MMLSIEHDKKKPITEFPEPAYAIFLAFDTGEYPHGDNLDPIEHFTRPLLKQILDDNKRGEWLS